MSGKQEISASIQDIWAKLNTRWKGEHANEFHQMYILKMEEEADDFEAACSELYTGAEEFSKKLQRIEQSIEY